ncbi:MAG: hypothetical protein QXV04_05275 [Desulfurococcaceae archaeon]
MYYVPRLAELRLCGKEDVSKVFKRIELNKSSYESFSTPRIVILGSSEASFTIACGLLPDILATSTLANDLTAGLRFSLSFMTLTTELGVP